MDAIARLLSIPDLLDLLGDSAILRRLRLLARLFESLGVRLA